VPLRQIIQRSKYRRQKARNLEKVHVFVSVLAPGRKECKQQPQLFLKPQDEGELTGRVSSAILVLLLRRCLTNISPISSQVSLCSLGP